MHAFQDQPLQTARYVTKSDSATSYRFPPVLGALVVLWLCFTFSSRFKKFIEIHLKLRLIFDNLNIARMNWCVLINWFSWLCMFVHLCSCVSWGEALLEWYTLDPNVTLTGCCLLGELFWRGSLSGDPGTSSYSQKKNRWTMHNLFSKNVFYCDWD